MLELTELSFIGICFLIVAFAVFVLYWLSLRNDPYGLANIRDVPSKEKLLRLKDVQFRIREILGAIYKLRGDGIDVPLIGTADPQQCLHEILSHYRLPADIDVHLSEGELDGPAGTIRQIGNKRFQVQVDRKHSDPRAFGAILAHELAHIWVDSHIGRKLQIDEYERDVDIATILLGAGLLAFDAVRLEVSVGDKSNGSAATTQLSRFGYITLAEMAYVYCPGPLNWSHVMI